MTKKKEDTKTLENKTTDINLSETEIADYVYLVRAALRNTPKEGATIDMMRKRMPVLDRLEDVEVGDKIELPVAELNTVKSCVKSMTWGFVSKDLIIFSDYIESL